MDVPVKLCYVDVDTEAISRLGNFPWNREYFASDLNALFDHGHIKAAGMDFVFSSAGISAGGREEAEAGNRALGKSLHKNKNVVVAAAFTVTSTDVISRWGNGLPGTATSPVVSE
jgi:adenylate cyclase